MDREMTSPPIREDELIRDDEVFLRMSLTERLQHDINILAFTVLIVTGLPLLLPGTGLARFLFGTAKAFHIRGVLHRAAAVLLIANLVWHAATTALTKRGREHLRDMTPRAGDVRDAVRALGHNLGLAAFLRRHGLFRKFFTRRPFWSFETAPAFDHFSFIDKFEYWSLVWGSVMMIVTGFFMWDLNLSLRLFPLSVHDIFIVIHSYEAILALLAILIWHMYTAHLARDVFPMSQVWLTGRIAGRELRARHPLEYARILDERRKARAASPAAEPPAAAPPEKPVEPPASEPSDE
jgi:cytochrome b subunit of formate dehydrogenase